MKKKEISKMIGWLIAPTSKDYPQAAENALVQAQQV
jgi:hypothetical protein